MSCNAKKDPKGIWRIQNQWTDWIASQEKSRRRDLRQKRSRRMIYTFRATVFVGSDNDIEEKIIRATLL